MINKHQSIYATHPEVVTIRDGVAYDENNNVVEYDNEIVEQHLQSNLYKSQRLNEYPSIGEQLDALFHAGVFPSDMADKIQAVKDKYPKV